MIQFSGMELVYDLYNPDGERVVSLIVDGKPIEPERLYSVASAHTRFQNNALFGAGTSTRTGRSSSRRSSTTSATTRP